MTAEDFTRAAYRRLLEDLTGQGYRVCGYEDVRPTARDLILRHDVDFWPEPAVEIGKIEHGLGLSAYYFFLVGSRAYDISDPETGAAITRLLDLGHVVALHFDAARYDDDLTILNNAAEEQCRALEAVTRRPIPVISFHRPSPALLQHDKPLAGRPHAYQKRFFDEIGYCSDSRGVWRFGTPRNHIAVREGRALQLLTHPIWWAYDDGGDREAALRRLIDFKGTDFATLIADTVQDYDPSTGKIAERTGTTL